MILPEPEDHSPAMARSSEVLPAPLGPTTSSDSPGATCTQLPSLLVQLPACCRVRSDLVAEQRPGNGPEQQGLAKSSQSSTIRSSSFVHGLLLRSTEKLSKFFRQGLLCNSCCMRS